MQKVVVVMWDTPSYRELEEEASSASRSGKRSQPVESQTNVKSYQAHSFH